MLENMNMKLLDVASHVIYHLTQSGFSELLHQTRIESQIKKIRNSIVIVLDNLVRKYSKVFHLFLLD